MNVWPFLRHLGIERVDTDAIAREHAADVAAIAARKRAQDAVRESQTALGRLLKAKADELAAAYRVALDGVVLSAEQQAELDAVETILDSAITDVRHRAIDLPLSHPAAESAPATPTPEEQE